MHERTALALQQDRPTGSLRISARDERIDSHVIPRQRKRNAKPPTARRGFGNGSIRGRESIHLRERAHFTTRYGEAVTSHRSIPCGSGIITCALFFRQIAAATTDHAIQAPVDRDVFAPTLADSSWQSSCFLFRQKRQETGAITQPNRQQDQHTRLPERNTRCHEYSPWPWA